ncbi:MAG: competence protein ComEA [Frankiaceae bacterium]|jgi:competence protein ComEA|nr:competence protein ComEA [Frankiaceae bacterium]
MRGDDDDLGTAAGRLPLGAGERAGERAGDAGAVTEEGWVPPRLGPAARPPGGLLLSVPPWLHPASARHLGWVAAAALVLLAGSGWLLLHRPAAHPPALPVPVALAPSPAPELQIVVDVGGRVRRPGLVSLAPGARVADALRAAGGALRPADVATLDLAARVSDGQLLLIGVPQPSAGGGGGPGGGPAPVSLSSATAEQLDALPGVGPVLARRIIEWRDAHGGFTSLSQLDQVPGVGPRTYERLKELVVL